MLINVLSGNPLKSRSSTRPLSRRKKHALSRAICEVRARVFCECIRAARRSARELEAPLELCDELLSFFDSLLVRWSRSMDWRVGSDPASDCNLWRYLAEHRSRCERGIAKKIQGLLAIMGLNKLKHFEHQFGLGTTDTIPFLAGFLVAIQPRQNWQGKISSRISRAFNDHAKHNPTMPPANDRESATRWLDRSGARCIPAPNISKPCRLSSVSSPAQKSVSCGSSFRIRS